MRALVYFCALVALAVPPSANARAALDAPYSLGEAFATAVRFVRVDRACAVTDKDPESAFVTFECKDDGHTKRGSVELWRTKLDGRDAVRLQVTLGDDPHYLELRFLELLERKLRDERGTPPPASAPSKKPPVDAGT